MQIGLKRRFQRQRTYKPDTDFRGSAGHIPFRPTKFYTNHSSSFRPNSLKNSLRHGVVSAAAERMAAGNAFDGKPTSFERAVFLYRFQRILRTSRRIPATRRNQRADGILVKPNQPEHDFCNQPHQRFFISCANCSRAAAAFSRVKGRCTRTTKSCGGKISLWRRNQSRITRFI